MLDGAAALGSGLKHVQAKGEFFTSTAFTGPDNVRLSGAVSLHLFSAPQGVVRQSDSSAAGRNSGIVADALDPT